MNTLGQFALFTLSVSEYRFRNLNSVIATDTEDLDHHGLFAIEFTILVNVFKSVDDGRNISE